MYSDILIPTDGSTVTQTTVDHGIRIATDHDATVHVIYVVDNRLVMAADDDEREMVVNRLTAEGRDAIDRVIDRVTDAGLEHTSTIARGIPHREILEYTEEHDVDLIAIGTHGKSPREKLQSMGSVTERVVDGATVPVLVVRNVSETTSP